MEGKAVLMEINCARLATGRSRAVQCGDNLVLAVETGWKEKLISERT